MSTIVFPYTLFNTVGRLVSQPVIARQVAQDQELFSAFFTMAIKTLADPEHPFEDRQALALINKLSSINSKAFSIEQLEGATKLAESIKAALGHHITAEYMGRFLAFADLFHELYSKTGGNPGSDITKAITAIGEHISQGAITARKRNDVTTQVEANIISLKNIYGFNDAETILVEHAAAVSIDLEAHAFIQLLERNSERKGAHREHMEMAFAKTLQDVESVTLGNALEAVERLLVAESSKPLAFNMVRINSDGTIARLSQFWTKVIGYDHRDGEDGFERMFLIPVKPQKSYSSVIARVNEKMIPLLRDVFEKVIVGDVTMQEPGVNVLLYGPSKLDKDQALHRALADINFDLYEANLKSDNSWGDEASITYAAQRLLEEKAFRELKASGFEKSTKHVLLVRDAVSVLSKGKSRNPFAFFGDKAAGTATKEENLDSDELLLTKSKTPTIWYASDPTRLSKEAVGKFMLPLEVVPGTRADRKLEVEKIADTLNLPPDVRQALSKYMELGASQVETAARVVKLLELEAPNSYETLLLLVGESQRALGRDKTEEIRTSVTKYDLNLLNIRSKFTPEQAITALKKKPAATLCFYGLPGTGKTQLAEFIADQLDKPLLVKRGSDILSKWVGENEQNIAEMFREAEAEGAVLLLDEADSFLRDRALSKNSWEVTMVNELLQGMERFKGIFICASNLFNQLDAAALRRFTFKFNFLELNDTQRVKMFGNESGVTPEIGSPLWDDLMAIKHLTPGDYATVKRQMNLFDTVLTPEEWITQLREEAKAKDAGVNRNFSPMDMA